VTPLPGLRAEAGPPGVLLVTPDIHVATPDVFAVFAATRDSGDGSVRMTSAHLAEELRSGLSTRDLVARASVLAAANDLLGAAGLVVPTLVPFRRALARLLGRPIGMSGSGPTLWALYPSPEDATDAATTVRAALAAGSLEAHGDGPPLVVASAILTGHPTPPGRQP
jgi:4-diphosphocytidyl-2C-methyl-D-erythritol kinase